MSQVTRAASNYALQLAGAQPASARATAGAVATHKKAAFVWGQQVARN
jgi:hypothetical protein